MIIFLASGGGGSLPLYESLRLLLEYKFRNSRQFGGIDEDLTVTEAFVVIPECPKTRDPRLDFRRYEVARESPPLALEGEPLPFNFGVSTRLLATVPPRDFPVGLADDDLRGPIH